MLLGFLPSLLYLCSCLGGWSIFSCFDLELSQPRTTFDEPCLTPVVNCNWRLILQLISRASKLLVTKGLQHEPDLTKRSFYWILSREPTEKTSFLASHIDWWWFGFGHGLVESKHKGRLVVVCGSLRTYWEWESIFHRSLICTRRMLCYLYCIHIDNAL